MQLLTFVQLALIGAAAASAFPRHASLAGLSNEEVEIIARTIGYSPPQPAPPPLVDDSTILVYDAAHPFIEPGPNDVRGPCPGLNTLSSHGYLDRSGVDTPQNFINAVQNGLNMGNDLATFVGFAAFLMNGNPLTNLMSVGGHTSMVGPTPPAPAIVGGLDTHNTFEGDASLAHLDAYFGEQFVFNQGLFDELTEFAHQYGDGVYNFSVAAQYRPYRVNQSIATNPTMFFDYPRIETAYAEAIFPLAFMVDGRFNNEQLPLADMFSFFGDMHFPENFHRRNGSFGFTEIGPQVEELLTIHPVLAGSNDGEHVNSFVSLNGPLGTHATMLCNSYAAFVGIITTLYPNPQGLLLESIKFNMQNMYNPLVAQGCTQIFPYGE